MKKKKNLHTLVLLIPFLAASILSSCSGGGGSPPPVVPLAPMAVSAVAGDAAVTLGWSAVTFASSYSVYRSIASGGLRTKIASGLSTTSYRDSGLSDGTPYYYVVTAVDTAGESAPSSEVSVTPDVASSPITISGKVQYQDKEYGLNGFTGNQPLKAVRYASIEIVDALDSTVTATTLTDSNGLYSISTPTTSASVYVRVKSEATLSGSTPQVTVKSLSGSLYAVGSNDFIPLGQANVSISVPTASIGGAFNILDVFTNGFQFVHSLANSYPPSMSGFWQPGNTNGTYYCSDCPQGEGIFILNDSSSGDTDEYDDDVLYHEFGHFMAAHFSQDDSPGGMHALTDNDLDMRLAWSEGWGDSMPGNIKMWLSANAPQLLSSAASVPLTAYVDTVGNSAGVAIDMDNPPSGSSYYYACDEVAIAKILLEINKDFGMQDIWAVFTNFRSNHPSPVNLELFWDQWHSLPATSALSVDSIFLERHILYAPDLYESDDTVPPPPTSTYTFGQPQVHTLYGAGDIDYIPFHALQSTHYTITTTDLLNGADTLITLLNSDGTTTTSTPGNPNDNANGAVYSGTTVPSDIYPSTLCDAFGICHDNGFDILGSKLTFSALSTGTYYVRVQSSPARPVSAGRYGTYTLTITSP